MNKFVEPQILINYFESDDILTSSLVPGNQTFDEWKKENNANTVSSSITEFKKAVTITF